MWERPTHTYSGNSGAALDVQAVGGKSFMEKLALELSSEGLVGLRSLEMLTCREAILASGPAAV